MSKQYEVVLIEGTEREYLGVKYGFVHKRHLPPGIYDLNDMTLLGFYAPQWNACAMYVFPWNRKDVPDWFFWWAPSDNPHKEAAYQILNATMQELRL